MNDKISTNWKTSININALLNTKVIKIIHKIDIQ